MREGKALRKFVKDRNDALLSLDREKIERFARKYGIQMPKSEEAFWRGVHKAIWNIKTVPMEIRMNSFTWLMEHGSSPIIGGADND